MSAPSAAASKMMGRGWVADAVRGFLGTYFLLHAATKLIAPFDAIASVEEVGASAPVAIAAVALVAGAEAGFGVFALASRISARLAGWVAVGSLSVFSAWLGVRAYLAGAAAPCACGMPGGPSIRDALVRNLVVALIVIVVAEIASRRR